MSEAEAVALYDEFSGWRGRARVWSALALFAILGWSLWREVTGRTTLGGPQ